MGGAYTGGACKGGAYKGGACTDRACIGGVVIVARVGRLGGSSFKAYGPIISLS